MFSHKLTFFINIFPVLIIISDLKCTNSMPKRYRIYRSKPPSMPPILNFGPPRLASAQNFHSDYAAPPPPFLMNGGMSGYPPSSSYDPPNNNLDYQPPGIQMEYGPPKINNEYGPPTTTKPLVHKHVTNLCFLLYK